MRESVSGWTEAAEEKQIGEMVSGYGYILLAAFPSTAPIAFDQSRNFPAGENRERPPRGSSLAINRRTPNLFRAIVELFFVAGKQLRCVFAGLLFYGDIAGGCAVGAERPAEPFAVLPDVGISLGLIFALKVLCFMEQHHRPFGIINRFVIKIGVHGNYLYRKIGCGIGIFLKDERIEPMIGRAKRRRFAQQESLAMKAFLIEQGNCPIDCGPIVWRYRERGGDERKIKRNGGKYRSGQVGGKKFCGGGEHNGSRRQREIASAVEYIKTS